MPKPLLDGYTSSSGSYAGATTSLIKTIVTSANKSIIVVLVGYGGAGSSGGPSLALSSVHNTWAGVLDREGNDGVSPPNTRFWSTRMFWCKSPTTLSDDLTGSISGSPNQCLLGMFIFILSLKLNSVDAASYQNVTTTSNYDWVMASSATFAGGVVTGIDSPFVGVNALDVGGQTSHHLSYSDGYQILNAAGLAAPFWNHVADADALVAGFFIPDYKLAVEPLVRTVNSGELAYFTLTATSTKGYVGTVTPTISLGFGIPVVSLNPITMVVPAGGSASAQIVLDTTTYYSTSLFPYTIVFQGDDDPGQSDDLQHTCSASLVVNTALTPLSGLII